MKVLLSSVPVFEDQDLVNCIRFALTLHEASNVPHTITVVEETNVHLTLIKK